MFSRSGISLPTKELCIPPTVPYGTVTVQGSLDDDRHNPFLRTDSKMKIPRSKGDTQRPYVFSYLATLATNFPHQVHRLENQFPDPYDVIAL